MCLKFNTEAALPLAVIRGYAEIGFVCAEQEQEKHGLNKKIFLFLKS